MVQVPLIRQNHSMWAFPAWVWRMSGACAVYVPVLSKRFNLKLCFSIPVDVLGKGLGKVFVITIQAAPRSLLTNCIPQGPFFSLQKSIQPSEPLSMRTLQKSIWTTQCQENIRFWTMFFQLDFCSKLLLLFPCRRPWISSSQITFCSEFLFPLFWSFSLSPRMSASRSS